MTGMMCPDGGDSEKQIRVEVRDRPGFAVATQIPEIPVAGAVKSFFRSFRLRSII